MAMTQTSTVWQNTVERNASAKKAGVMNKVHRKQKKNHRPKAPLQALAEAQPRRKSRPKSMSQPKTRSQKRPFP